MKYVWFLINSPSHPCDSSMTRYMLRIKMHIVATANAAKNPLNLIDARSLVWLASRASSAPTWRVLRIVMMAKSVHNRMKTAKVITWKASPATMIWSPLSGDLWLLEATLAMPPPIAWSTRDIMSHGIKIRGKERGLIREFDAPNVITIRDKVRYIPAAKKAGAMVKQIICNKKPF